MTKKYKCRVEYLESTGTQYIDTGYKLNSNSVLEVSACSTDATQSNNTLLGVGTSAGSADRVQVHFGSAAGTLSIRLDGTLSSNQSVGTNKFISKIDISNKKAYFNNIEIVSNYTGSIDTTDTVALFNRMISGNVIESEYAAKAKVYYLRISENNALVRDLIPVLDNSGRPAMYDQVSGQLFYNQGSGDDFSYGRQIIPVEYLESTGTQYIDTGVILSSTNKVEALAEYTGKPSTGSSYIFGTYGSSKNFGINADLQNSGNFYGVWYNQGTITASTPKPEIDTRYKVEVSSNGIYINDTLFSTVSGTFTGSNPAYLFWANGTGQPKSLMKLYSCQMWNGSNLVRDFIPCIDENLTPFMFDKVNNTVYLNAGTGQFKVGPNVEKTWGGKKLRKKLALMLANLKKKRPYYCEVEYLESDSTAYIDTGVSGANDNLKIEMGFSYSKFTAYGYFFSNYESEAANVTRFCLNGTDTNTGLAYINTRSQNGAIYTSNFAKNSFHTFVLTKTSVSIDGNTRTNNNPPVGTANTKNIILFNRGSGSYTDKRDVGMRCYYFRIYDNDVLIRDFIPVLDWNYTPCMFDRVTEQLFYNQATSGDDFSYGREIHYVDYLKSTGVEYIDTGIKFDGANTKIEVKTYEDSLTRIHSICGDDGNFFYYFRGTRNWAVGYNGTAANIDLYMSVGDNVFVMDKNNVYVNGVLAKTYTASSNVSSYNALLFNRKTSLVDNGAVTMYYCKIWNNDVLVRDYIPAIDENDTYFMFDKVSHTCYNNAGSGSFIGPTVSKDGNGKIIENEYE